MAVKIIKLGVDSSGMKSGFAEAANHLNKFRNNYESAIRGIENAGRKMTIAITAPIVALSAASLKVFATQETAVNNLSNALTVYDDNVAKILPGMQSFASHIQDLTAIADEDTIALQSQLRILGVMPGQLKEATKQAIGLTTVGIGLSSAARYVSLAIKGDYTMLQRYIPTLRTAKNEAEKKKMALDFLAKAFETTTKQGKTFGFQIRNIVGRIGDMLESIGDAINKTFNLTENLRLISLRIKNLTQYINNLNPFVQTLVIAFGAMVASIGPILIAGAMMAKMFLSIALATQFLIPLLPVITTAFVAMLIPFAKIIAIGAVVAGIGYLIYKQWDNIAPMFEGVREVFADVISESGASFTALWETLKPIGKWLVDVLGKIIGVTLVFAINQLVIGLNVLKGVWNAISIVVKAVALGMVVSVGAIVGAMADLVDRMKQVANALPSWVPGIDSLKSAANGLDSAFKGVGDTLDIVKKSLSESITEDTNDLKDAGKNIFESINRAYSQAKKIVMDEKIEIKKTDATGKEKEKSILSPTTPTMEGGGQPKLATLALRGSQEAYKSEQRYRKAGESVEDKNAKSNELTARNTEMIARALDEQRNTAQPILKMV